MRVQSLGGEDPWSRQWQPTPVFFPGESHQQRSLEATVHGVPKSWTQLKRLSRLALYIRHCVYVSTWVVALKEGQASQVLLVYIFWTRTTVNSHLNNCLIAISFCAAEKRGLGLGLVVHVPGGTSISSGGVRGNGERGLCQIEEA